MEKTVNPKSGPVAYCDEEEFEKIQKIIDDAMADIQECMQMLNELKGCVNEVSARLECLPVVR